jgi:hypothetical protein
MLLIKFIPVTKQVKIFYWALYAKFDGFELNVLCIEKMSTMDIFFATKSASHVKYFSVLIKYSAQTSSFKIRTIYSFHFEQFIRHISSNLFRSI